eukprot:jgi/Astpho2/8539/Aster-05573
MGAVVQDHAQTEHQPLNFIYSHLHNSIRSELNALNQIVLALEPATSEHELMGRLVGLKERYRFLESVYKYHSSVEDEVVYPALDVKVKNVTLAYTVEHEDEERLFDQLSALIGDALVQQGKQRGVTLRALVCKVQEIHTTLHKHLAKEEEQLLPLLLQHFTHAEQATLVTQFLCCIPLATVEAVLAWLKPQVPEEEQQELLAQVKQVVPDQLLLQLLCSWLGPQKSAPAPPIIDIQQRACSHPDCCKVKLGLTAAECAEQICSAAVQAAAAVTHPPLHGIAHFHAAIRSTLERFVNEASKLQQSRDTSASQLRGLVERHRFLRAVCTFHAASENEVLFPAVKKLLSAGAEAEGGSSPESTRGCEDEHQAEAAQMDKLGHLLSEVTSSTRRGSKEAASLMRTLCSTADAVCHSMSRHMAHEEADVLPLLEKHLCAAEQRAMVWRTLRGMPLRLLERVMPWVAASLTSEEAAELVTNMQLAAPAADRTLVQLLTRWTKSGTAGTPPVVTDVFLVKAHGLPGEAASKDAAAAAMADEEQPQRKRRRTEVLSHTQAASERASGLPGSPAIGPSSALDDASPPGSAEPRSARRAEERVHPIDHIFQFHKALRRDLHHMEQDVNAFAAALEDDDGWDWQHSLQQLEGRFRFLDGIYRAHSEAEDDIVFPALESKEALHRVSHAYSLDHQQEAQLFADVHKIFERLRAAQAVAAARAEAQQLQQMTAAMRASLEQHVNAEERELWPLFAEHFTCDEQQRLVGRIIGRTGAEVLQAMLPWVIGSFTPDEQRGMMDSLRSATRHTMFDQWLDATLRPMPDSAAATVQEQLQPSGASGSPAATPAALDDVAAYLTDSGAAARQDAGGDQERSSSPVFRPGWEDIFRMNQKQLEVAVRRMWNDRDLEPKRKAYLMQNIMASKYIVAQQKRLQTNPTRAANTAGLSHLRQSHHPGGALGCAHYKRRVKVLSAPCCKLVGQPWSGPTCKLSAPCCHRMYVCRLCHDQAEDHLLDPHAVNRMACMKCGHQQAPAGILSFSFAALGPLASRQCHIEGSCANCQCRMARYFCSICHLYDDEEGRSIYHCPFCNLCRVGRGLGMDACHCMECNACMHLSEFPGHKCRDVSTCPVCTEYLFDSRQPYRELPCGHFMHSHCFGQYTKYNYTCPVCSKSMGDMSVYFRMIDSLTARIDDLPPEYASRRQNVLCHDCGQRSEVPFHFVYHKCGRCASYNTRLV